MNIQQLRETLAEQIGLLRKGSADPKHVNAIVNASGKILASIRLEMDYAKMIGAAPAIQAFKPKRLR